MGFPNPQRFNLNKHSSLRMNPITPNVPLIIAVTPPGIMPHEHRAIELLCRNGIGYVHVRKPDADEATMREYLSAFAPEVRARLSVHYHHRLALETGCGGIHESKGNTVGHQGHFRKSKSCHSVREVMEHRKGFEYLFLSPVFDSISKEGYRAAFDPDGLQRFLRHPQTPLRNVVALGGICADNAPKAREMGFAGIALLGALWASSHGAIDTDGTLHNLHRIIDAWNNR